MKQHQQLGLDELMIVNPGTSGAEAMFLGEDGMLYQVEGLEKDTGHGTGQYVLGDDRSLYYVQGFEACESQEPANNSGGGLRKADDPPLGRYFLGADGVLYEVVR